MTSSAPSAAPCPGGEPCGGAAEAGPARASRTASSTTTAPERRDEGTDTGASGRPAARRRAGEPQGGPRRGRALGGPRSAAGGRTAAACADPARSRPCPRDPARRVLTSRGGQDLPMPAPGAPLERLGFLTIGLFDPADPADGHETTLRTVELGERLGFDS